MRAVKVALAIVLCTLVGFNLRPQKTLAADVAQGIQISPVVINLNADPGQTYVFKLSIMNTTTGDLVFHSTVNDFQQSQDLKQWVTFSESVATIPAKGSHHFSYTLGAPPDAEPGGKYIAVFATIDKTGTSGNVTSIERAGTLLYITVKGNVSRQGQVISLNVPHLIFSRNVSWSAQLRNTGNDHFNSRTTIDSKTISGSQVNETIEDHLLLPNTVRLIHSDIAISRWPGIYQITFKIGQGDSPAFIKTTWVLYMPPLIFILILIVVIAGISWAIKKLFKQH